MRALYVAATGMNAQQTRIDTVANNLANVNTTGYKKSREVFQDLFYQELVGVAQDSENPTSSIGQVGAGVRVANITRDHSAGHGRRRRSPLHMAINGTGYFVLETTEGDNLYTRDGSFTLDPDGYMITASGLRVSGDIQIPLTRPRLRSTRTVRFAVYSGRIQTRRCWGRWSWRISPTGPASRPWVETSIKRPRIRESLKRWRSAWIPEWPRATSRPRMWKSLMN